MKNFILLLALYSLISCKSDNTTETVAINGAWGRCVVIPPDTYHYQETIYSNNIATSSAYVSIDSQCINIKPVAFNIDTSNYVISNPHISTTGLLIYDYNLTNVIRNNNNTTGQLPNYYNIIYINDTRIYSGLISTENDGESEASRPIEINFDLYLTKK